jgi:hypothetical protein
MNSFFDPRFAEWARKMLAFEEQEQAKRTKHKPRFRRTCAPPEDRSVFGTRNDAERAAVDQIIALRETGASYTSIANAMTIASPDAFRAGRCNRHLVKAVCRRAGLPARRKR